MNKLRSDALRSDCVGCFVVYLAKKIVIFTKNQLFYKKKSGKNLVVSKKSRTFAPSNTNKQQFKNNYNNEKEKNF